MGFGLKALLIIQRILSRLNLSSGIRFSNIRAAFNMSHPERNRPDEQCKHRTYSVTVEGSTLCFNAGDQLNLTVTFIYTSCPDCLAMCFDNKSKKTERLWLFSRRREVNAEQLEEFKAQAECLKKLPPAPRDHTRERITK